MRNVGYDETFERELYDFFDTRLPDKIFDAHVHINRGFMQKNNLEGDPYEFFKSFTAKYMPRELSGAMVMPQPSEKHTRETFDDDNGYNIALAKREKHSAGLLLHPTWSKETVEETLDQNPEIKVLKPYLVYAQDVDNVEEADVNTFAAEWMWELANEREMPILLHLSHYGKLLSHPGNYEQINYFCKKYPKAKLVLAHCAMGHNVERLRRGLEEIKGLKNVWFDSSGAGEAAAVAYCVRYFGAEKMLYGGDFDYGTLYGRIYSYGASWHAMRPSPERDAIKSYRPINNLQDCLLQLIYAIDAMGLKEKEVEDIFYNNAMAIYG